MRMHFGLQERVLQCRRVAWAGYVEFFADAMRWPVDAFASRTASDDNRFEHHVAWLNGNAIDSASYVASDEATLSASVHS